MHRLLEERADVDSDDAQCFVVGFGEIGRAVWRVIPGLEPSSRRFSIVLGIAQLAEQFIDCFGVSAAHRSYLHGSSDFFVNRFGVASGVRLLPCLRHDAALISIPRSAWNRSNTCMGSSAESELLEYPDGL